MPAQVVWLEEIVKAAADGQLRSGPLTFADRVFQNEINYAIRDTQQVGICFYSEYPARSILVVVWMGMAISCAAGTSEDRLLHMQ